MAKPEKIGPGFPTAGLDLMRELATAGRKKAKSACGKKDNTMTGGSVRKLLANPVIQPKTPRRVGGHFLLQAILAPWRRRWCPLKGGREGGARRRHVGLKRVFVSAGATEDKDFWCPFQRTGEKKCRGRKHKGKKEWQSAYKRWRCGVIPAKPTRKMRFEKYERKVEKRVLLLAGGLKR